jgi:glutamate-1-semialdehyde 2,1-aminomutase
MKAKNVHGSIEDFGKNLMKGIEDILRDRNVSSLVRGFPSMFQILFTDIDEVSNYRDLRHCDFELFGRLQVELLRHGVMFDEDNGEPLFTFYSHTREDLDKTLEALDVALPHALEKKAPLRKEDRFSVKPHRASE